jgi:hypothetical protein
VKALITPVMVFITVVFFSIYITIGTLFWLIVFFRLLFVYALKITYSVFTNEHGENVIIDEIVDFTIKHFQLSFEILKIPSYVWVEYDHRPQSQLKSILAKEKRLFDNNKALSYMIFVLIALSFLIILNNTFDLATQIMGFELPY